jgi:single-strand DNA-binding protein
MANFNKIMLMGNIVRDPEVRYTANGTAVCSTSMAINERYRSAQGEDREETCFIDLTIWGKQGETLKQYVKKGDPLFVEGTLKLDQWQDKATGANRSKHSVRVERFQFLPRSGAAPQGGGFPQQGNQQPYGGQPQGGFGQQTQGQGYQQMPPAPSFGGQPQQASSVGFDQPQQGGYPSNNPSFGGGQQGRAQNEPMPSAPKFEQVEESDDDIPF